MQSIDMMTLDEIVSNLQLVNSSNLWREANVIQFEKRTLTKPILCGKTNALINTYFSTSDDPHVQHIGEQLLEKYKYADEYLVKLQLAIVQSIDNNRAIINSEKQRVQDIVKIRARTDQNANNNRIAKYETSVLQRINQLPEDVVNHIKSYLPPPIILCAMSIPAYDLTNLLSPLKLKNVKIIYDRMRKKSSTILHKLRGIAARDVIRDEDIDILIANQPGASKLAIIGRIRDICYCYNLVLNILSRLKNTKPRESRDRDTIYYCNEANKLLYNELTYLYKLMNFAARPQHNGRAKPKPKSKPTNSPEMPIVSV
jgi:hypothetical protein